MSELTKKDLKEVFLESLEPFAKSVQKDFQRIDKRFDDVDKRFDDVDKRFDDVDKRFGGTDQRLEDADKRLNRIEANMVTKDYLDDKLADLKGDLVVLMRKEDKKLRQLVDILHRHKVLSEKEVKEILSMDPFPQLFVR